MFPLSSDANGSLVLPFRMLRRERLHAVEGKQQLKRHRLLGPEGAIVVEGGDAFGDRHEIGRPLWSPATQSPRWLALRHRRSTSAGCWPSSRKRKPERWAPPLGGGAGAGDVPHAAATRTRNVDSTRLIATARSSATRRSGGRRRPACWCRRQGAALGQDLHVLERSRERGDPPRFVCFARRIVR